MLASLAFLVCGATGVGILLIGARFLLAPQTAAAGYGVPVPAAEAPSQRAYAWLYAKGLRDIASGIFLWLLLINGASHPLGAFMIAASHIPVGDAAIVLRSDGTRAAAYGIHGATAAVLLAAGGALLLA